MKYVKHSLLFLLLSLFSSAVSAQDEVLVSDRDNPYLSDNIVVNFDSIVFGLYNNPRSLSVLRDMRGAPQDVQWSRVIYRYVPLKKTDTPEVDDFLYLFPEISNFNERIANPKEPLLYRQRVNHYSVNHGYYYSFMSVIVRLLSEGKINAYRYSLKAIDESFSHEERLSRDEFMKIIEDRCGVTPEVKDGKKILSKDGMSYASEQFIGLEMKEMWYFDARSSEYGSQVLGMCPFTKDKDSPTPLPLFWISYDEIYPYLTLLFVNNPTKKDDLTLSYASFFSRKLYDGYVYRLPNPDGKTLIDDCGDPVADPSGVRAAWKTISDKIDKQLLDFAGKELWALPNDPDFLLPESVIKSNAKRRAALKSSQAKSTPQTPKAPQTQPAVEEPVVTPTITTPTTPE